MHLSQALQRCFQSPICRAVVLSLAVTVALTSATYGQSFEHLRDYYHSNEYNGDEDVYAEPESEPKEVALEDPRSSSREGDESTSALGRILLYLPNRVFDLLDIVRLRAKVGPGVGAGVRVTEYGELFLGSHMSVFAGLPGPRRDRKIPVPLGVEGRGGVKVSVLDGTMDGGLGPEYSDSEIGASLHLLLVGADVMIDPVELVDALLGIFMVDLREDDL